MEHAYFHGGPMPANALESPASRSDLSAPRPATKLRIVPDIAQHTYQQPTTSGTSGNVIVLPVTNLGLLGGESHGDGASGLRLNLIGQFQLMTEGFPVTVGSSGQRLLALLACHGRQKGRTQVAQMLWPNNTNTRSNANLRTTIYRLQHRLPDVVQVTNTHIQLDPGIVVDLDESTYLARQLLVGGEETSLALCAGQQASLCDDLLPDWDDDWLRNIQFTYRQLRLNTLEALADQLISAGCHGSAVEVALAAVEADPLRETAHAVLIRAWIAQGNRNDAISHYRAYGQIMREELGLDPSASLGKLIWSA
jgi:DNA-binding SARP family transcriptional activator